MGLVTRLFAAPAEKAAPPDAAGFGWGGGTSQSLPALGSMPTASGVLVSQATALQVSTVYACAKIRARDLARCTPQILRDDGRGNKAVVADHPLAALFRKPNRVQAWYQFAEQMHVALMLRSNAFAAVLRDWRGTPTELIPLNPDLVTPMEAPDGSLFYSVSRAGLWLQAMLADQAIVIPAEDVLHVRDLTFNTLVGVSRIALARDAIGLAMVQEQQAGRWAGNGARPAGVLQSKKTLSPEAAGRLRQQWDDVQSGVQNTGRTAILEDGLEWRQMALNSVDLEFGNARLYQVKEVARFFEVPLHKLGENESLPRASIAELNADYVQNTVMGDATRWEQAVELHFGIGFGDGLEVKLDEKALLRADLATMTNAARSGVLSGLITPNEGRAIIGYGPMDGADTLLAPVNLAPNGSAIDGVAPDNAGRPPVGLNPGDMKTLVDGVVKGLRARGFDPDQPRDDDGKWAGGSGDGASGAADGDTHAASRAALSHEVKLVVEGTALVAATALAALVLPEAVAGSFLVAGALGMADNIAWGMFTNAGVEAATHALKDMGVSTKPAEDLVNKVREITKAAGDAHNGKLRARLAPVLRGAAVLAHETVLGKLQAQQPGAPASLTGAVDAARDGYLAKVEAFAGATHKALKYSENQPRDAHGRFAAGESSDAGGAHDGPTRLSTGQKVRLAVGVIGLAALGAALHRKVPYKSHGSAILDARYKDHDLKQVLGDLHQRSVHTPLTEAERKSLVKYTGADFRTINKKLRLGHKPTEDVDNIDSALKKSLLSENTVVYRGVNLDRSKRLLGKYAPGDIFVDKGYPSTSLSEGVARDFAKNKDGAGSGHVSDPAKHGYVWSVNVDKGTNALPLTPGHTYHDNLVEMLLPRNSAFKVLSVDHEAKTIFLQHTALTDHIVKLLDAGILKAADNVDEIGDDDPMDRFLIGLDDLDHYPAPDDDTTAVDYAGYRPPQPPEPDPA